MSNESRDPASPGTPPARVTPPPTVTVDVAKSAIASWATWGILLLIVGAAIAGLSFGQYVNSGEYDYYLDEAGEPSGGALAGVVIGSLIAFAGTLVTSVAIIAKGVQVGNLASR